MLSVCKSYQPKGKALYCMRLFTFPQRYFHLQRGKKRRLSITRYYKSVKNRVIKFIFSAVLFLLQLPCYLQEVWIKFFLLISLWGSGDDFTWTYSSPWKLRKRYVRAVFTMWRAVKGGLSSGQLPAQPRTTKNNSEDTFHLIMKKRITKSEHAFLN